MWFHPPHQPPAKWLNGSGRGFGVLTMGNENIPLTDEVMNIGLQRCLGKWFVSTGIHWNTKIQSFPAEYNIALYGQRYSFQTVSGFNVVAYNLYLLVLVL